MSNVGNEPAYPQFNITSFGCADVSGGMTLRDYFAANHRVSIDEAVSVFKDAGKKAPTGVEVADMIASIKFIVADAMLAERVK